MVFPRPPVLGPALPPGFRRAAYDDNDDEDEDSFPGPALPPGYRAESSSSEDEDVIGPMPCKGPIQDTVALDFERRSQRMKEKLTGNVSPEAPANTSTSGVHCANAYLSTGKNENKEWK